MMSYIQSTINRHDKREDHASRKQKNKQTMDDSDIGVSRHVDIAF